MEKLRLVNFEQNLASCLLFFGKILATETMHIFGYRK